MHFVHINSSYKVLPAQVTLGYTGIIINTFSLCDYIIIVIITTIQ